MFNYTYETTVCSAYNLRETRTAVLRAKIDGELSSIKTQADHRLRHSFEVTPYVKTVPAFHHPLAVEDIDRKIIYVADQRPNMVITRDGAQKVSQTSNYNFLILRTALEQLWNTDAREDMLLMGAIPFRAYSRLLSENISRRLGLTPDVQQQLSALTGYFYQCQFTDAKALSADEKLAMAIRIKNFVAIPTEVTLPLIDELPILTNMESFCDAVRLAVPNPRFEKLNPAFLISICGGVWFGPAAKEIVAVSLEYPPTFIAMVHTALNDRTMHGALFSKLVDQIARNSTAMEFNNALLALMETVYDE